jgi:hypothetical protein
MYSSWTVSLPSIEADISQVSTRIMPYHDEDNRCLHRFMLSRIARLVLIPPQSFHAIAVSLLLTPCFNPSFFLSLIFSFICFGSNWIIATLNFCSRP